MQLERTKSLAHEGADLENPVEGLRHVLESALELVSLPENDFSWSSWPGATEAQTEIQSLLKVLEAGRLPEQIQVSVIFAPTGPLQELSLSSGWAEPFLKVAEIFDAVESILWPPAG